MEQEKEDGEEEIEEFEKDPLIEHEGRLSLCSILNPSII
jgi:hypothetical protein